MREGDRKKERKKKRVCEIDIKGKRVRKSIQIIKHERRLSKREREIEKERWMTCKENGMKSELKRICVGSLLRPCVL